MKEGLEGSRCGSGKALDKFRQARMLVGTVVIMVGRREAGLGERDKHGQRANKMAPFTRADNKLQSSVSQKVT